MEDDKNSEDGKGDEKKGWSTGAVVGAAIGSAAVAAALIYARRHRMRKIDDYTPPKGQRYENEPVDDDEDPA